MSIMISDAKGNRILNRCFLLCMIILEKKKNFLLIRKTLYGIISCIDFILLIIILWYRDELGN